MSTHLQTIGVWCLLRDQFAHVRPVEEALGAEAEFYYDDEWNPEKLAKAQPDVVICVNDFHYDIARCLEKASVLGIPSLTLQDGILEWRCQYENPLFGAGGGAPQHQPVLADKIACLGPQSARQIAAWGNAHQVEITGMPRLDYLLSRDGPAPRKPGNRIVVMTAKNPGFTAEQREIAVRSLRELKQHLETRKGLAVSWRVSPKVAGEVGVENQYRHADSQELTAVLRETDAVITTPSTAMLEAMLLKRPVACLDYHNVPRFVPTAWTISAPEHVGRVVDELLEPSARKLAFQEDCLQDCLLCDAPAAARTAHLIRAMVQLAKEARREGRAMRLPVNMLEEKWPKVGNRAAQLCDLYPEQAIFRETSVAALQLKLARLENENYRLKRQLRSGSLLRQAYVRFNRWRQERASFP